MLEQVLLCACSGVKFQANAVGPPGIAAVRADADDSQLVQNFCKCRLAVQGFLANAVQEDEAVCWFSRARRLVQVDPMVGYVNLVSLTQHSASPVRCGNPEDQEEKE